MDIRTKIISTIIAMVCSISVSATGIAVILLDFPISVANTTSIQASDIQGDLFGWRTGAGANDLTQQHLYKNGFGVQTDTMNYYLRDVNFAMDSKTIEYKLGFIVAEGATSATFITLDSATITNESLYEMTYKISYSTTEPDWNTAENMVIGKTYVADSENRFVWLKATLKIKNNTYERLNTGATWSFAYTFSGASAITE